MMEYLFIYLLQFADVIDGCADFFISTSVIFAALTAIGAIYWADEKDKGPFDFFVKSTVVSLILLLTCNLIPTKQTLLLMGGTYLGKKAIDVVATDEKIKKVDTIINLQLDKYIKELQNETGSVE